MLWGSAHFSLFLETRSNEKMVFGGQAGQLCDSFPSLGGGAKLQPRVPAVAPRAWCQPGPQTQIRQLPPRYTVLKEVTKETQMSS